jgi:NAD(P) transhydrogenase
MLDNPLLTTVGSLIGVSGSILSYIMVLCSTVASHFQTGLTCNIQCTSMNRSLTNVLFGGMGTQASQETHKIEGSITKTTIDETAEALANADSVILVSPSHEA